MRELRNPFRMRTSEHIESEVTFLRLFGPGVLDILPKENLWNQIQIFRSAPGGGKTSLFRVFTPKALITLYESRANEDYKELFKHMKTLDVISNKGLNLLGIKLSCAKNYAMLDDLNLDQTRKDRLFFSLLNSRLVLSALQGASTIKNIRFPQDIGKLRFLTPANDDFYVKLPVPCTGKDLYDWACSIEERVCETIDSFVPPSQEKLEGHDGLYALSLLRPENFTFEGVQVVSRVLVMLDDVHKLTSHQRQKLLEILCDNRPPVSVWLAERLEALNPNELLAVGATNGREYVTINLEDFWRRGSNSKRFENAVTNIADRRARSTQDTHIGFFGSCLKASLDGTEWQERFERAIEVISSRIINKVGLNYRYQKWIESKEALELTPRERAIEWRELEILIERDFRKIQPSLDFGAPLELDELKESSNVKAAAEFFISNEFKIPYYFGISRLATLASSNIEQFLAFAGDLFEEIISASLLRRQIVLSPERQETILKKSIHQRWIEIPRRISNGRDVQKFLEAINHFARWETKKPNAPYAPGVTGIALTMADRNMLINEKECLRHPEYVRLLHVLSACISYNLLEVSLDRSQGQNTWMILYLNRWLCLKFELPLQYGGWRPKKVIELCKWIDEGFRPSKNGGNVSFLNSQNPLF
ncbi:MAG: hypothetical protein ACOY40_01770 [Bacillota bacterium]